MTDPRPREVEKKCVQTRNRFGFPLRAACDELRAYFDPHETDYAVCESAQAACDHHEPLYVTPDTQTCVCDGEDHKVGDGHCGCQKCWRVCEAGATPSPTPEPEVAEVAAFDAYFVKEFGPHPQDENRGAHWEDVERYEQKRFQHEDTWDAALRSLPTPPDTDQRRVHVCAGGTLFVPACTDCLAVAPLSPDTVTSREFVNELGNSVRITIEGPTSMCENVLTTREAAVLKAMLPGTTPFIREAEVPDTVTTGEEERAEAHRPCWPATPKKGTGPRSSRPPQGGRDDAIPEDRAQRTRSSRGYRINRMGGRRRRVRAQRSPDQERRIVLPLRWRRKGDSLMRKGYLQMCIKSLIASSRLREVVPRPRRSKEDEQAMTERNETERTYIWTCDWCVYGETGLQTPEIADARKARHVQSQHAGERERCPDCDGLGYIRFVSYGVQKVQQVECSKCRPAVPPSVPEKVAVKCERGGCTLGYVRPEELLTPTICDSHIDTPVPDVEGQEDFMFDALHRDVLERLRPLIGGTVLGDDVSRAFAAARSEIATLRAQLSEREAEVARRRQCSTCYGVKHSSGLPCVCGGTNRADDEVAGLRSMVFDTERQLSASQKELAEARRNATSMAFDLRALKYYADESRHSCVGVHEHNRRLLLEKERLRVRADASGQREARLARRIAGQRKAIAKLRAALSDLKESTNAE